MKFLKNKNKAYTKNKSIVLLSIYGVFFIFVFIMIAIGNSNINSNKSYKDYMEENDKNSQVDKLDDEVTNYEYSYKITDNTNIIEVSGTKTKDKEIFTYNGLSYYKQDNSIYLNDVTKTLVTDDIFNTDIYNYESINNLVKGKNTKEKTTYEDGTIKEMYSINSKEYFDYMKDDKCINIDCSNINIDITINRNSKNQIEKVNINLTSYYKYNYTVEIIYNNINNIKEVSTN